MKPRIGMEDNKAIVRSTYPNAICQAQSEGLTEWFVLRKDGDDLNEKLLEFSFVSEEEAWRRAARKILTSMVSKLEL